MPYLIEYINDNAYCWYESLEQYVLYQTLEAAEKVVESLDVSTDPSIRYLSESCHDCATGVGETLLQFIKFCRAADRGLPCFFHSPFEAFCKHIHKMYPSMTYGSVTPNESFILYATDENHLTEEQYDSLSKDMCGYWVGKDD